MLVKVETAEPQDLDEIEKLIVDLASMRGKLDEALRASALERAHFQERCNILRGTLLAIRSGHSAPSLENVSKTGRAWAERSTRMLTPREKEVLRLIADGFSTKEIAG